MKHSWFWCGTCGWYAVRCGTCGLNQCSATTGVLEDGSPCPDCDSAYNMMVKPSIEEKDELIEFLAKKCQKWCPHPSPIDNLNALLLEGEESGDPRYLEDFNDED